MPRTAASACQVAPMVLYCMPATTPDTVLASNPLRAGDNPTQAPIMLMAVPSAILELMAAVRATE